LVTIDEYLKEILGQILASYKTLTELNDNPNDLEIIKKELSKIRQGSNRNCRSGRLGIKVIRCEKGPNRNSRRC